MKDLDRIATVRNIARVAMEKQQYPSSTLPWYVPAVQLDAIVGAHRNIFVNHTPVGRGGIEGGKRIKNHARLLQKHKAVNCGKYQEQTQQQRHQDISTEPAGSSHRALYMDRGDAIVLPIAHSSSLNIAQTGATDRFGTGFFTWHANNSQAYPGP
jgi:hypothetical protein